MRGFGTQLLRHVYAKFPFIKLQYGIKFWEFENQNETWEISSTQAMVDYGYIVAAAACLPGHPTYMSNFI